jgi:hypothetical protein
MSMDVQPRRLATLADEIRAELDAADGAFHRGLQHAIAAGEKLIEAKSLVRHGEWIPWLELNFPFTARWARACMRVARAAREGEIEKGSAVPISEALEWIAKPKAPATNLLGEVDPKMEENGDDWRSRLLREQGIAEPGPRNGGGTENSAPVALKPGLQGESENATAEASAPESPPNNGRDRPAEAAGEVLDDPLGEARRRYSSAASQAFKHNDARSARYALALLRNEIRPALERIARDGVDREPGRWQP